MAGKDKERQERGFLKAVKDAVKKNKNNPITLIAGSTKISGVSDASKYTSSSYSSEPYTDVVLKFKKTKNSIFSNKKYNLRVR